MHSYTGTNDDDEDDDDDDDNNNNNNAILKQGVHIHQPKAWPVPNACTQPYQTGIGSHGQLFRPYWSSSTFNSRQISVRTKTSSEPLALSLSL